MDDLITQETLCFSKTQELGRKTNTTGTLAFPFKPQSHSTGGYKHDAKRL
jgi:hypothetical protein